MSISFVLVQCIIGHEMEVLRELLKFDLVKEAKGTFGYYDILVKVIAPTDNDIEKFIIKKIRKICFWILNKRRQGHKIWRLRTTKVVTKGQRRVLKPVRIVLSFGRILITDG